MGKQVSLIQFTGKVGEVYGAVDPLKGGVAIRKMPVRKETKATEDQIVQRVKFGTLTSMASAMSIGLAGLANYAKEKKMRTRNAFVTLNKSKVDTVKSGDEISPNVTLDELILSKGNAVGVSFGQPDLSERDSVTISYETSTGVAANSRVIAIVFQADLGKAVVGESTAQAGSVQVHVPREWSGMRAHMYGYTLNFASQSDAEKFDALYATANALTVATILHAASEATPSDTTFIGTGNLS